MGKLMVLKVGKNHLPLSKKEESTVEVGLVHAYFWQGCGLET